MIRIYRDKGKQSLLNDIKTIRNMIGEVSPSIKGLIDGIQSNIEAENLSQALKLSRQLNTYGQSQKISKVKTLAKILIENLRKETSKETDKKTSENKFKQLKDKIIDAANKGKEIAEKMAKQYNAVKPAIERAAFGDDNAIKRLSPIIKDQREYLEKCNEWCEVLDKSYNQFINLESEVRFMDDLIKQRQLSLQMQGQFSRVQLGHANFIKSIFKDIVEKVESGDYYIRRYITLLKNQIKLHALDIKEVEKFAKGNFESYIISGTVVAGNNEINEKEAEKILASVEKLLTYVIYIKTRVFLPDINLSKYAAENYIIEPLAERRKVLRRIEQIIEQSNTIIKNIDFPKVNHEKEVIDGKLLNRRVKNFVNELEKVKSELKQQIDALDKFYKTDKQKRELISLEGLINGNKKLEKAMDLVEKSYRTINSALTTWRRS